MYPFNSIPTFEISATPTMSIGHVDIIKGHCHWDFAMFKSSLGTFILTQNAPTELRRRYQMKVCRECKTMTFFSVLAICDNNNSNETQGVWLAPSVWFLHSSAHCSVNKEAMGSNPVEALKNGYYFAIASIVIQVRWSRIHFRQQ